MNYIVIEFILAVLAALVGYVAIILLGRKRITKKQKVLVYSLSGTTIAYFLVYGLLGFSPESGPPVTYGTINISYGYGEPPIILLNLLLPIILGIWLIAVLDKFNWWKRFLLPVLLVFIIGGLNTAMTSMEFKQITPIDNMYYSCPQCLNIQPL